jgi:hypothetical protein
MTKSSRRGPRLVALFLLGCLMFNYPLLALFNVRATLFGIPLLYAYLFAAWALLIALVAAVTRPGNSAVLANWVVVLASFGYLGLLFAIAYCADRRKQEGRSVIASPVIYSLSLAVYATAWTFYGSVGRAAHDGVGFLPIYIGPTLTIVLGWFVLRKMLRIAKQGRITSLADFVASRYGKSALLGGLVTIIAVIGILPYISLQLKAVASSFQIVFQYPELVMPQAAGTMPILDSGTMPILKVTAFYVALALALFTIAFGTRTLDVSERHEGMVAAIAFESLVKLVAFLAVGVYVTFFLFDGFGDIFGRAAARADLAHLLTPPRPAGGAGELGVDDDPLDARDPLPAAAVPGRGDRERRGAPPAEGAVALPALHARHQHLRAADRFRRPAHVLPGRRRCRQLRADAAHVAAHGGAHAAGVRGRHLRGHGHGDRRDDRIVDDGFERPHHAAHAALGRRSLRAAGGPSAAAPRHTPRRDRGDPAPGLLLLRGGGRGLRARINWARIVRGGRAVRARAPRRAPTGRGRPATARSRASRRGSRSGSTRCCCRPSPNPAGSAWTSSRTAHSASRSSSPRSSSASRASTRRRTR